LIPWNLNRAELEQERQCHGEWNQLKGKRMRSEEKNADRHFERKRLNRGQSHGFREEDCEYLGQRHDADL
jgi:hypothetical protein